MLEVVLICIAVCADAFAAACAFGIKGVRVGLLSALLIGLTGAAFLGASLVLAGAVSCVLSGSFCKTFSAAVLILLAMKNLVDAHSPSGESAPATENLSVKGSLILASALSVDSLGVGFGAGVTMTAAHKLYAVLLCLILGVVSVLLGHFVGRLSSRRAGGFKTALVSSAILFVTAVMKLV